MTKRQIIDEIVGMNRTAEPEFLARFSDDDLNEYLTHLNRARAPRLSGDPKRYDRYFQNAPAIATRASSPSVQPVAQPAAQPDMMSDEPITQEESAALHSQPEETPVDETTPFAKQQVLPLSA